MEFDGLQQGELQTVCTLNREFLRLVRQEPCAFGVASKTAERIARLGQRQLERLQSAPFLLFSLQQHEDRLWQSVLAPQVNDELLEHTRWRSQDALHLATDAVGFLWQLAQVNPYAARLVSGGSVEWCEAIAGSCYVELLRRVRQHPGIVSLRDGSQLRLWEKMLGQGTSASRETREAAQYAVLHIFLAAMSPASTIARAARVAPTHVRTRRR